MMETQFKTTVEIKGTLQNQTITVIIPFLILNFIFNFFSCDEGKTRANSHASVKERVKEKQELGFEPPNSTFNYNIYKCPPVSFNNYEVVCVMYSELQVSKGYCPNGKLQYFIIMGKDSQRALIKLSTIIETRMMLSYPKIYIFFMSRKKIIFSFIIKLLCRSHLPHHMTMGETRALLVVKVNMQVFNLPSSSFLPPRMNVEPPNSWEKCQANFQQSALPRVWESAETT